MDFLYYPYLSHFVNNNDNPRSETQVVRKYEIVSNEAPEQLPKQPRYKLTYFNGRGMTEISRFILAYRGIDFTDNRLEFADWWSTAQESVPYRLLPLLEFDGKLICQSTAIARYLARMHGLAGNDPYEQAQVDSVIDIVKEFTDTIHPYLIIVVKQAKHCNSGFEDPDTRASVAQMMLPAIDRYLPLLQIAAQKTSKNTHGFIFDSGLTIADFAVVTMCEIMDNFLPNLSSRYPPLNELKKHVLGLPELQHYLQQRPKTVA